MQRTGQTQLIYKGRVVHLTLDEIALPDGRTAQREVIHHAGAVAVVVMDSEQKIFLVQQYRIGADAILYEIPAGLLEPDEDPQAAAIREVQEETGYRPAIIRNLGGLYVAPGYTSEFIHLYLATDLTHAPLAQDDDEFITTSRVSLSQALTMIDSGEICDGKTITALLKVAREMGQ